MGELNRAGEAQPMRLVTLHSIGEAAGLISDQLGELLKEASGIGDAMFGAQPNIALPNKSLTEAPKPAGTVDKIHVALRECSVTIDHIRGELSRIRGGIGI